MESRIFASPLEERAPAFSAIPPSWRTSPRGDVVGGLLAAVVSLPLCMGLGALAFSPFGADYIGRGVLAGLFAAAFLGLVAIVMGARGVAIYAPRSLVSFMIASVAADLFLHARWLPANDPDTVTAAIFLLLALSGAFQLAFGCARLAEVVKFIPTPVMAGFQNSAAIIILLAQVPILLGLAKRPAFAEWPAALADIRPLGLLVGAFTLLVIFQAKRITARVPPLVLALLSGTLLYYTFVLLDLQPWLGPTIGHIAMRLPDANELATIMALPTVPGFREALPAIVLGAASIAVVASLDVLISAKIVENLSGRRGNTTQELISIGAANLVTPLFGGIAGSINLAATTTAIKGGARNSLALLAHALIFLAFVPLLVPVIEHVPLVVIAALLVYAGSQLIDRWTLQLIARVAARKAIHWPSISIDLSVIVLVASVAIAGEVVAAVLLGVSVAVLVFILRMSRGVIRREQYGDVIVSRRARVASDRALLVAQGRSVLALELEGPLFFGTAEMLHNRVDKAIGENVRYVILDVARVTELDSTGARIMLQAEERLSAAKCRMVVCGAQSRPELAALLVDLGVAQALTQDRVFPDLDRALEWCENDLLARQRSEEHAAGEHPFELLDLLRDVHPDDHEALRAALVRRDYETGQAVFRQGDADHALYIIVRGSASVWMRESDQVGRRMTTFSQGTFFGEMAFIDRELRSATVTADEPLTCYVLERAAFDALAASHPRAGLALLANLGRELSLRTRRTSRTLVELG